MDHTILKKALIPNQPDGEAGDHPSLTRRITIWLQTNWFILLLILVLVIGQSFHRSLAFLVDAKWFQNAAVFSVMFLMALPLPWMMIRNAVGKPWPAVLGSAINLIVVPAFAIVFALFLPRDLGHGLIVASLVPSTIASAAVWTRRGGGDDTYAVLITLITTFASVVTTPLGMAWLLKSETKIEVVPIMTNLFLLVIAPILIAQLLRRFRTIEQASTNYKPTLSVLCQIGILMMVLVGAVQMGIKLFENDSKSVSNSFLLQIAVTCAIVMVIHLSTMFVAIVLARLTRVEPRARVAVAFAGSQKTLMVGLKLAIDAQASILPMVAYHVLQLIVDAFLAGRWNRELNSEVPDKKRAR